MTKQNLLNYIDSRVYDVEKALVLVKPENEYLMTVYRDFLQMLAELKKLTKEVEPAKPTHYIFYDKMQHDLKGPVTEQDLEQLIGKDELQNGTNIFGVSSAFVLEKSFKLLPSNIA